MKKDKSLYFLILFGIVPVIWLALLLAPHLSGGLFSVLKGFSQAMEKPFSITPHSDSAKTMLLFLFAYAMGIGIYFSTRRNYRRGEEHGSASWGSAEEINRKYRSRKSAENRLLTQNVRIGLNDRRHRRNLNVLVVGGSGAGKTRFYCKPNIMQANTSFVVLDPKGGATRSQLKRLCVEPKICGLKGAA